MPAQCDGEKCWLPFVYQRSYHTEQDVWKGKLLENKKKELKKNMDVGGKLGEHKKSV